MTNATTTTTTTTYVEVLVTYPAHVHIGGGDPYRTKEHCFKARYTEDGAVLAPRIEEDGTTVWECCFCVENAPRIPQDRPLRRAMVNHGSYASAIGGSPVLIARR